MIWIIFSTCISFIVLEIDPIDNIMIFIEIVHFGSGASVPPVDLKVRIYLIILQYLK
jgi:hypothetical protein